MKHIKLFEQFLNERQDEGLFPNNSPKNKNKFLFPDEMDTLVIPVKRAKIVKDKAPVIGDNYNFAEFANACVPIGSRINLGRDRYDIYPQFTLIIPNVTEMTFDQDPPKFKNKINFDYVENKITRNWQTGVRRDGYYWMMNYGGSVTVNTKTIRERFERTVGTILRETYVNRIDWVGLNIQRNDRLFNPVTNQEDLWLWLDGYYYMPEYLLPAYEVLNRLIPQSLTMKIKTLKY